MPVMMDSASVSARKGPPKAGARPGWQQQVLEGLGLRDHQPTAFKPTTARADEGIIGLCNKGNRERPTTGALRAWAWGAPRAQYFETDKDVDAKQVGIEGLRVMARPRS